MSMDFVGSPNFSPARHSNSGSKRSRAGSRASSLDHRLSIIAEDSSAPPTLPPPQTHNRPFSRRFLGEPPRYRNGHEPPKYSLWDVTGPKGEKFEDLRNNAYVARRGGWKRICLIAVIIIACLIALIVGLVVGLNKKHSRYAYSDEAKLQTSLTLVHHSSAAPPSPSPSSSPSTGPFPAGSYTFTTFLDTAATACTSNNASWKCDPSVTYAEDPTNSEATFNWIITASGSNFTISSTNNPFAIDFSNATLLLLDQGSPDERYTFTTNVQKVVFPSFSVKCFYNTTEFTADLYTKKAKSYPSNSTSASATSSASGAAETNGAAGAPSGGAFAEWNFAVDATQSVGGGVDVPACYNLNNGQTGSRVTSGYTIEPAGDFCSCAYKNYDPFS